MPAGSGCASWPLRSVSHNNAESMKGLTLLAPWAEAVFSRGKDVENTTWKTPYRGPLAIHAGMTLDLATCAELHLDPAQVIRGAIIGVVDLVDVVTDSTSPWAMPGYRHLILANPRRLDVPIPCKGRYSNGLWTLPHSL
jgi:hypothetical protein